MVIEKLKIEDLSQVLELHKTLVPFEIVLSKQYHYNFGFGDCYEKVLILV